jgi:hypothetical protein
VTVAGKFSRTWNAMQGGHETRAMHIIDAAGKVSHVKAGETRVCKSLESNSLATPADPLARWYLCPIMIGLISCPSKIHISDTFTIAKPVGLTSKNLPSQ